MPYCEFKTAKTTFFSSCLIFATVKARGGLTKYIRYCDKFGPDGDKKLGAELNEMAFYHSISSITNTIWYMDVQKYQSWRKLGQLRSVGKNYFLCHVLTI